jgi:hypothetical protein
MDGYLSSIPVDVPGDLSLITIFLVAGLALYFIPSLIALLLRNRFGTVFLVNLLTGWTTIGWVVALVFAVLREDVPKNRCPECREPVQRDASRCPHCRIAFGESNSLETTG